MRTGRRWAAIALLAVAILVAGAFVVRHALASWAIRVVAGAAGFNVAFESLHVGPSSLSARRVRVDNRAGEPIARIGAFDMSYSLRDLLPGGAHAYGLTGFDLEHARFTLIRHPDGSFNVPVPKFGGGAGGPLPRFAFRGRVRDVALDVEDRAQGVPSARRLAFDGIDADLDIDVNARSRYRVAIDYAENGRRFPIEGKGDVDVPGGFGMQRWHTARLPIERLVDVALNSPSFHIVGGSLYAVDARIAATPQRDGTLAQHVSATATIDRARIAIGGLVKPLRDVGGPIAIYGDGLLLDGVTASIAGVPIRLGGGIYRLASPQFRLTVAGRGDLRDLRTVLAQSAALPLSGPASLNVAVEGAPSKPLVLVALSSPHIAYADVPIDAPTASIAFDGQEVDVVDARTRYAGIDLLARGRLNVRPKRNALEMTATLDAPANVLPYAAAIVPGLPVRAELLAIGDRPAAATVRGIAYGDGGGLALSAPFDVRSEGAGTIGPLRLDGGGRSLYAIAALDAPHRSFDAYAVARNLRVDDRAVRTLPGVRAPSLPPFAATVDAALQATGRNGSVRADGVAALRNVRGAGTTVARATARFSGTPDRRILAVLSAGGIGPIAASAGATIAYAGRTLDVRDAAAASRGTFADARGRVNGIGGTPTYAFDANVHSADVDRLVALVHPGTGMPIEGSVEARVHVAGSGSSPSLSGTVASPEGAVNGLAFHALSARFAGTPRAVAVRAGHVGVGSSAIAFDGNLGPQAQRVDVAAPNVDLQNFNDFFDPGDMLAGKGGVRASVALAGSRVVATSGNVGLRGAAVRGFQIGDATARWHGPAGRIESALAFGGASGRVSASGTAGLDGSLNVAAHARDISLAQWLPMAGLGTLPVTGVGRADATVSGRYPNINAYAQASVAQATVGRVSLQRAEATISMRGGRGRIVSGVADVPHGHLEAGGAFGLLESDPLALTLHATTENVAALAKSLTDKSYDAAGALDTTLRVGGTRAHPVLDDAFTLTAARYGAFQIPRAAGRLRADARSAVLSSAEVDLVKGRVLAAAAIPIQLMPFALDDGGRAISGSLTADGVDASNVAALLPKGTNVTGRLDGHVALSGTVASPRLGGALDVSGGSFSGPQEKVPIVRAGARAAFAGNTVYLQRVHAEAGGGSVDGAGSIVLANLREPSNFAATFDAAIAGLQLDLPQYFKGKLDGNLHVAKATTSPLTLGGSMAASSARIPLTALYNPKPAGAPAPLLPDVAFNMRVEAGRDVRVISSNVDVPVAGSAVFGGTLRAPTLDGSFTSSGGTVSFLRTFRIQRARARFTPSDGVIPTVRAVATTYVADPPTDVTLTVTGLATALNVAFDSSPPYDRAQILGLLVNAQALGAVRGVASTGGGSFSAGSAVANLAAGQLNQVFTRNLLEPLSLALGEGLGLSDFQITSDIQTGLGVNAARTLGKNVTFIFAQSFNETRRTSWTIQARPSIATQLQFTAYTTQSAPAFALSQPPALYPDGTNMSTVFLGSGTNGVDFKLKRTFW